MGPTQVSKAVAGVLCPESPGFPTGVTHVRGVNAIPPPKSALEAPNGSHYSATPSSIEAPATTLEPALVVFCDFETRNTGGCDLTKAGAWRYAADPATEILCFGYRTGGVDHSWAPTSPSRDPLAALAADPDAMFASFGGFEAAVWDKIMVERHKFAPI
jgi:hypothetical protein